MKKSLLLGLLLAALTVVGIPLTTNAERGSSSSSNITTKVEDTVNGVKQVVQTEVETETEHGVTSTVLKQEIQAKRDAIEQRVAEKRAAITEKLSGKRAELCEKKQENINRILDNRVLAAQRHFDKFAAIQDRLVAFVTEKQLSVDDASALEVIMNDKKSEAQATIDAANGLDFTCADADAAKPGQIVKDQVSAAKEALKDYRSAIKDYAKAVKSAASAGEDSTSTDTPETEAAQ